MSYRSCKLGEVCVVRRGTTITQKQAIAGEIPVVAGGLKPTYFHNTANRFNLTITVSGSGANAGFVNLWKQPIFASDCSTLEVNDSNTNLIFIYYFLLSKQEFIYEKLRSGAAQPHVYGKDISQLDIELPPLIIQQKIVTKLDAIFNQIDKAKVAAEENAKNAEALFQSYLREIFVSESIKSNGISLDSLCDFLNGFAFKSTDSVDSSNTQLLRMGNLYGNKLDLERSPVFYPDSFKNIYSKFILNVGDIVVSLTGTVGKRDYGYAINVPETSVDLLLNQRLLKIYNLDFNRVNYKYFNFYLHSSLFLDELYKSANGTRQANLSSDYIKKMKIPLCTMSEQLQHVKSLMSLKESCESLRESSFEKLKNINLLKQSILRQSFNGELVKE